MNGSIDGVDPERNYGSVESLLRALDCKVAAAALSDYQRIVDQATHLRDVVVPSHIESAPAVMVIKYQALPYQALPYGTCSMISLV